MRKPMLTLTARYIFRSVFFQIPRESDPGMAK